MLNQLLTKLPDVHIFRIFFALAVTGILSLIYDLFSMKKRKRFGEKYLEKYNKLLDSRQFDEKCYQWLLHNLQKIVNEMGVMGTVVSYQPAFSNYLINNYPIVANTIMHMRDETISLSDLRSVQTHLERYIGALDYLMHKLGHQLFNPFKWLTRAVRLILVDGPLWILQSVGIIRDNISNTVSHHSTTRKIVGMITFFATLVSIVSGWDKLVEFLSSVIQWLLFIGGN